MSALPSSVQTLAQALAERARSSPDAVAERHKRLGIWQEFTFAREREFLPDAQALVALGDRVGRRARALGERLRERLHARGKGAHFAAPR